MSDLPVAPVAGSAGQDTGGPDAQAAHQLPMALPAQGAKLIPVRALHYEIGAGMPSYPSALAWRNAWSGDLGHWLASKDARHAMRAFDGLGGSEHDRAVTQMRIASACVAARAYVPETDPGAVWRSSMARQREEVGKLATAARVLANACRRNDRAMFWLLDAALPSGASEPTNTSAMRGWEVGFRRLQNCIDDTRLPELHGGPWWLAHTLGNLHFPEPIKPGRRQVGVATMLAAEHTAGRARDIVTQGQFLPSLAVGRPCYSLVAQLVDATLGTRLDDQRIRDRLVELPAGMRLIRWPESSGG